MKMLDEIHLQVWIEDDEEVTDKDAQAFTKELLDMFVKIAPGILEEIGTPVTVAAVTGNT